LYRNNIGRKLTVDEIVRAIEGQRGVYVGPIQKIGMRWVAPHLLKKAKICNDFCGFDSHLAHPEQVAESVDAI
jgi:hypothetical protein